MMRKRGVLMRDVAVGLLALALLAVVCPRVRVGSRFHRGLTRALCALSALALFSLVPGARVGVNALTAACVSALGLPGLAVLQVISMMP